MKIGRDKTSYRARGVIKRDAKHTHADPETPAPTRGKKDRKRWCGGHPGREHKPECRPYGELKYKSWPSTGPWRTTWKELVCAVCGKTLATHAPWPWNSDEAAPEWAKVAAQ